MFRKILTSPILFGGLASFIFYVTIDKGWISSPLVHRYFAGHPVEYVTTVMFFVGAMILLFKYVPIILQRQIIKQGAVLPKAEGKNLPTQSGVLLESLRRFEKENGVSVLTRRLAKALQFVHRNGSADDLDDELRYLADDASAKADNDYGLVRLILWAVPMLGFLGTVIGITSALDNLDLNAINESSKELSAGLAVAFDTTGLAIALDVLLFFAQFVVYREETQLLAETGRFANEELRGRFQLTGQETSAGSLTMFSEPCPLSPAQFVEALRQNAAELIALRKETIAQTEALRSMIGSQSEMLKVEEKLRQNLAAIANVGNFEETVNSLAATIHLLNTNRRNELRIA